MLRVNKTHHKLWYVLRICFVNFYFVYYHLFVFMC